MIVHTLDVSGASSLVHDFVPTTLAHASAIAGDEWQLDPQRLVLTRHEAADDDAWVRLGMILELLAIRGAVVGIEVALRGYDDHSAALEVSSLEATMANDERLASCTNLLARPFAAGSSRVPAHASARLSSAASVHGARLTWHAAARVIGEITTIAASTGEPVPAHARAVAIVHGVGDDVPQLVAGGRATARVCLEAASLGLSILVSVPIARHAWAGIPAASSLLRTYRALVEDDALELMMIWVG